MYGIRIIQHARDDEIERMVDVLHEAFSYRYFIGSLGDPERSKDLLRSHINAALVDKAGEVHVAETRNQEIVGVAVWFGPGTTYLRTMVNEAQRKAGWNQLYAQLEDIYQNWWDYFLPFYDQYTTAAFGDGVKLAGYHLQVIGVLPARQGQGIASSFFRVVEKKAKARQVCTCLETVGQSAVPVYRSLGYEVKDPIPLRSAKDPNATSPLYGFIKWP